LFSMASGRLDLFIAKLPLHTIVLTLGCTGSSSELAAIPRNSTITLVRGTIKQAVQVQFLEGRECFADFIEMNFALARRFQLQPLHRYMFTYNTAARTLSIQPAPISESVASLLSQSTAGISIGYELVSKLGIPERQGLPLRVRYGKYLASLRLQVPANLSDDRLRLPAYWIQKWRIAANQPFRLQYDQRNSMLSLTPLR